MEGNNQTSKMLAHLTHRVEGTAHIPPGHAADSHLAMVPPLCQHPTTTPCIEQSNPITMQFPRSHIGVRV